jgi:hypothetical protein
MECEQLINLISFHSLVHFSNLHIVQVSFQRSIFILQLSSLLVDISKFSQKCVDSLLVSGVDSDHVEHINWLVTLCIHVDFLVHFQTSWTGGVAHVSYTINSFNLYRGRNVVVKFAEACISLILKFQNFFLKLIDVLKVTVNTISEIL